MWEPECAVTDCYRVKCIDCRCLFDGDCGTPGHVVHCGAHIIERKGGYVYSAHANENSNAVREIHVFYGHTSWAISNADRIGCGNLEMLQAITCISGDYDMTCSGEPWVSG